jgi:AcrR family transcriptional regulator
LYTDRYTVHMNNREVILEKAVALFSHMSYEGVSIREIVTESGVTKPTLYHYFKSKKGLMETILAEGVAPVLNHLSSHIAYTGDVMECLRTLAREYSNFAMKQEPLYRLYKAMCSMPLESESYTMVKSFKKKEIDIFLKIFKSIAGDHGNIRGRYKIYARTFLGLLEVYNDLLYSRFTYPGEDLLYRMLHQYMHGIFS